jgi:hypothetical protein
MAAGPTYEPIATVSTSAASYTFSSIPSSYTDLVLVISARSTKTTATSDTTSIRFNGDTGSNYSNTNLYAISTPVSNRRSNDSQWFAGEMSTDGEASNIFTPLIVNILNYSNTSTYKVSVDRVSNASLPQVGISSCLWRSTSAINSITIYPAGGNFVSGSTLTLYGIAAA